MEFACYTDWEQLPESANALFAEGAKQSMFFSRPWFENLVNTALETDQFMLLACVVEDDRMLAILPLMQRAGENHHSLCHLYSSFYSLLLTDKDQPAILACLAKGLSQLPVRTLQLRPFDENDKNVAGLQQALEADGFSCHRGFRFYNWVYPVAGQSFAEYMAERPARMRNTIGRKQRKLEREHGYEIRLFTDEGVEQGLADYKAIYSSSWKAKELFGDILEGLVISFSRSGWLRLAVLYIDKQPAAAQLWFVVHGKASIFRLAYDEAWKQYSPGSILTQYLMEYVIDTDKVEEIDFLTGNERYKQDWMSERRERWGMSCMNRRKPRGRGALWVDSLKGLMKRPKVQV